VKNKIRSRNREIIARCTIATFFCKNRPNTEIQRIPHSRGPNVLSVEANSSKYVPEQGFTFMTLFRRRSEHRAVA
jgi:hypothetical protein